MGEVTIPEPPVRAVPLRDVLVQIYRELSWCPQTRDRLIKRLGSDPVLVANYVEVIDG